MRRPSCRHVAYRSTKGQLKRDASLAGQIPSPAHCYLSTCHSCVSSVLCGEPGVAPARPCRVFHQQNCGHLSAAGQPPIMQLFCTANREWQQRSSQPAAHQLPGSFPAAQPVDLLLCTAARPALHAPGGGRDG